MSNQRRVTSLIARFCQEIAFTNRHYAYRLLYSEKLEIMRDKS